MFYLERLALLSYKFPGPWLVASLTQIRSFLCTFKLIWVHLLFREKLHFIFTPTHRKINMRGLQFYRLPLFRLLPGADDGSCCLKGLSWRGRWWWGAGTDPEGVKDAGVAEKKNLCRSLTRLRDDDRMKLNGMWAGSVEQWDDGTPRRRFFCGNVEWYAWMGVGSEGKFESRALIVWTSYSFDHTIVFFFLV